MDPIQKKQQIAKLEKQAGDILNLKNKLGQRRPILIEFCGTPKSGKTTSISSLNTFLKRNKFKTEIIQEMAGICPVENKTHPYFNSWTLFSSLAETLKLLSLTKDKVDIIIVDRSIFDSMCWFEWLNTNNNKNTPYLDDKTYEGFRKLFLETSMWSSLFDLTIIFKANPTTAMHREYANLLTERAGSIMNEDVLTSFNIAIDNCYKKYENHFRRIEIINTSEDVYIDKPAKVGLDLTKKVLGLIEDLLMEQIGYFDNLDTSILSFGINEYSKISNLTLKFDLRDKVESSNYIQPVPICVITNEDETKILIVKKNSKRTEKSSPEANRHLCYLGGHIRIEDKKEREMLLLDIFKETLHREIQEEVNQSVYIQNSEPFLIYTPDTPKSKKHLAVCFVVKMDLDNKKFKVNLDEFARASKNSKSGSIVLINDIEKHESNFESWTIELLKHIFNQNVKSSKQMELFID